jgi:hypothetical protein
MNETIENRMPALPKEVKMIRMDKHSQRNLKFIGKQGRITMSPGIIAIADAGDLDCLI